MPLPISEIFGGILANIPSHGPLHQSIQTIQIGDPFLLTLRILIYLGAMVLAFFLYKKSPWAATSVLIGLFLLLCIVVCPLILGAPLWGSSNRSVLNFFSLLGFSLVIGAVFLDRNLFGKNRMDRIDPVEKPESETDKLNSYPTNKHSAFQTTLDVIGYVFLYSFILVFGFLLYIFISCSGFRVI